MSPLERFQNSLNHFQSTLKDLDNIRVDANQNPIVTPKFFMIQLENLQNLYNTKLYFKNYLNLQDSERFNQFFEKLNEQVTYFSEQNKLFLQTGSVSVLKIESLIKSRIELHNICDELKKETTEIQNKRVKFEADNYNELEGKVRVDNIFADIPRVEKLISLVTKFKSNKYNYVHPDFYKDFFELARKPFCNFLESYMKSFGIEESDEEDERTPEVFNTIRYLFYLNKFSKDEYETIFAFVFNRKNRSSVGSLEAFNKELIFAETVYQGAFKPWSQNASELTMIVSSNAHEALNSYLGPAEIITEYLNPSDYIDFFEFCMNVEWKLSIEESVE